MKFKLDENLPAELLADLQAMKHDAETVTGEGLTGSTDPPILAAAKREGRILLTMDKGIADVRAYPPHQYPGIVLFRPRTSGRGVTLRFVRRHLPAILEAPLAGHLLVVSEQGMRIR